MRHGSFEVKFAVSYNLLSKGRIKHSRINLNVKYTHAKWQPFNGNSALFSTEGQNKN